MQCLECELENVEGALYCARCHKALPRLLAPGECPFCGLISETGVLPETCPSCGNDAKRGQELRERRAALLLAELAQERQALETKVAQLKQPRKAGCLPVLIVASVMTIGLGSCAKDSTAIKRGSYGIYSTGQTAYQGR